MTDMRNLLKPYNYLDELIFNLKKEIYASDIEENYNHQIIAVGINKEYEPIISKYKTNEFILVISEIDLNYVILRNGKVIYFNLIDSLSPSVEILKIHQWR